MAFVPAYSWFASRVDRMKLILGVTVFFVANIVAFALSVAAGVAFVGVAFYVWVGFFSLSIIAQFWSYANDIYTKDAGNRLFPVIGIGMTAGTPVGAWIAERLFHAHVPVPAMLYLAAGLLLSTLVVYTIVNRRAMRTEGPAADGGPALAGSSGFSLVARSPYILLIVGLLVVLNVVNTTGEYILSHLVVERADTLAAADPAFQRSDYIGSFYGSYFLWVNVFAVLLQAFVASRLVKYFGLAGVLLALPLTALGAYAFVAAGATLSLVRWAKTAENSADYSVMNTARQLLWLPTTRDEKYKAKQAADSFFVRLGDLAAALVVFAGTAWATLDASGFAMVNLAFIVIWLGLAVALVRRNRGLVAASAA
jgi:AAA family ATP:ADP antiporter